MITNNSIDNGKPFDWGRASSDYAKYRDIYPEEFYQKILSFGLCKDGQKVLDIGTGTGVIPRNMYRFGADFTGTDISENQIEQAKKLSAESDMDIDFLCCPTEKLDFPEESFDVITACQCFFYFDHDITAPKLYKMLKKGGKVALLYMAWLPSEDKIAGKSERLILEYNPEWTGCNEKRHEIFVPEIYRSYFKTIHSEVYDIDVPFTRESWNGRIKACRGIGASLDDERIADFEREHLEMLGTVAPEKFDVLHYAAVSILEKI